MRTVSSSLLRPLIHREWARHVARVNDLPESELEHHLFGRPRVATTRVLEHLTALQDDRCFYCDARMLAPGHVDHFIPWARHPENAIQNLVVADARCNLQKRDFLAARDHLAAWTARLSQRAPDLAAIAADARWETAHTRALGVARALYFQLRDDSLLWHAASGLDTADPAGLRSLLDAA
ncbi:MAG: hypothetical protein H6745_05055 [Deltaproteobacteria bacterium]|nr:hypothetical protein [Deltaproteobacteria bacterium]